MKMRSMKIKIVEAGCYNILWTDIDCGLIQTLAHLGADSVVEIRPTARKLSPEVVAADILIGQWQRGEIGRGEFVDSLREVLCPENLRP